MVVRLEKRLQAEEVVEQAVVYPSERFVRLDSQLLQFGLRHLSAPAIKILHLVLARWGKESKWSRSSGEINITIEELRPFLVPSGVEHNQTVFRELMIPFHVSGTRQQVSWFRSISQVGNQIRFQFDPSVLKRIKKPYSYTTFSRPEINRLKSAYAIKVFQVLRSMQNRQANWYQPSRQVFSLKWLKYIMGIPAYKRLDDRTIRAVITEINRNTFLQVFRVIHHPDTDDWELFFRVKGRKRSSGQADSDNSGNGSSSSGSGEPSHDGQADEAENEEILLEEKLSESQQAALQELLAFGIKEGFALRVILPRISRGEIEGYEDFFVRSLLAFFFRNVPDGDAEIFMEGWTNPKEHTWLQAAWRSGLEQLRAYKEQLEKEQDISADKSIDTASPLPSLPKGKKLKVSA